MQSRKTTQRGSALMLVPAGVLILLLLGAIAVDSSIAFMTRRDLENQAAAAANDAVTEAIDPNGLQLADGAAPDPQTADRIVHEALDGRKVGRLTIQPDDVQVTTDQNTRVVTVRVAGDAPYLFASGIPGVRHSAHVVAQASAQLRLRQP